MSTYVFEVGLIAVIIREFRVVGVVAALYLAVLLAYGGVKLVRASLRWLAPHQV